MPSTKSAIPVSAPDLSELERRYLMEAFDSGWISSTGSFVERFEREFAGFAGVPQAITCTNGTAALHLALLALEIGPGDEVIVPSLTYVATANAVRYVGAEPVFADCDPQTWNIDPGSVERLITDRTRAIVAVHLFGNPAEMRALRSLTESRSIGLIEDASEAHGAILNGSPVGGLGDIATFSFYANKILATGEGGMVCTGDARLADRVRSFRGQGVHPIREYWFETVGYNYRMTNMACAVGLAQLHRFDELRARRERVRGWYETALTEAGLPLVQQAPTLSSRPVLWIKGVALSPEAVVGRDELRSKLAEAGIETRPFFAPLHTLPMYRECRSDDSCRVSRTLGENGVMLPTYARLAETDVTQVVDTLAAALASPMGA